MAKGSRKALTAAAAAIRDLTYMKASAVTEYARLAADSAARGEDVETLLAAQDDWTRETMSELLRAAHAAACKTLEG